MFWLAEVFNGRYTEDELRRHEAWARQQRAETVAALAVAAARGLGRLTMAAGRGARRAVTGLAEAYGRQHRRRAAIRELNGLSDYILRDIGLYRGDIHSVVEGLLDGKPDPRPAARAVAAPEGQAPAVPGGAAGGRDARDDWQRAA